MGPSAFGNVVITLIERSWKARAATRAPSTSTLRIASTLRWRTNDRRADD